MPSTSAVRRPVIVTRTIRCVRMDVSRQCAASNTPRKRWQYRPRAGFLASVRDVEAQTGRLDTLNGPLSVEAERLSGNDNNILYRFALRCDERLLLTGRATVMLDASGATLTAARALSPGL
jgi:predicted hotdog family 3-hydroxylacyl-ACP dehydratase